MVMGEHGVFHWNELMTDDAEGMRKFYSDTLGWTFDDMPMPDGTYTICMSDGQPVGGIFPGSADGMPKGWFAYIAVDDIDARLEKAKASGAQVAKDPFDVPGVGRIAIVIQPDGSPVGWMTPAREG